MKTEYIGTNGSNIMQSTTTTKDMISREINNVKSGNLPTVQGIVILLLTFVLIKKGVKLVKIIFTIISTILLLLYLGKIWG